MIKSKILYGLCVAALGLPFAEAMDRKLPNVGDNGVEKLDRTPYSRFDEQKPVCKVDDNKPTFDSLFVKTFKEKLNRYLHSYKSRNQVVLKGGNVDNDSLVRYGQGGIKRQASQAECPKKKDNSTSDISQFSSSSNSERERPTNTLIPEIETGQQLDALSQPVCDLTEEDVHNDETIKGKAKKLLKAIDNPSYDKNKREKLENELQALGVCRTNAEYGDDLLKIQLDVFLNPHKPEYEDWPRNDYNEIVWKGKIGVQLTHKENEWLEYLLSVCETNFEIVATFKNVFMREIDESCVRKQRYKNSKESQKKRLVKVFFVKRILIKQLPLLD